ncbi:AAA family ATPase [Streptomyces tanashiensis]
MRTAKWSAADAVLIDETKDLVERTHSLGHVVLDEAQDLSPMQYRAVGRRCTTGSATVLGDLAQGTTPWATESWAQALGAWGSRRRWWRS